MNTNGMTRARLGIVVAIAAALTLAGCSADPATDDAAPPAPSTSASTEASAEATPDDTESEEPADEPSEASNDVATACQIAETRMTAAFEENTSTYEAVKAGDYDTAIASTNAMIEALTEASDEVGHDGVREALEGFRTSIVDLVPILEDMKAADGDDAKIVELTAQYDALGQAGSPAMEQLGELCGD